MEKITLSEKRFFEWHIDDKSVTLREKGGSYGGGSEVLVIQNTMTKSEVYAQMMQKELTTNMSIKER